MKKIYLPHINYTVSVGKHAEANKPHKFTKASTLEVDSKNCTIYLSPKPYASEIAHEVIHALQFIARARGIDFESELEHFGYMAQYITMRITGGKWM